MPLNSINFQKIIIGFEEWYKSDIHSNNEDYYRSTITLKNLSNLKRDGFIEFFSDFANDGGMVQSEGYRNAGRFISNVNKNYNSFRRKILEPFSPDFKLDEWIEWAEKFKYFGKGLATIYLNRVDKNRFVIVNNKSIQAFRELGFNIKETNLKQTYHDIFDAQSDLIIKFPILKNYYKTDALAHFLIGTEEGKNIAKDKKIPTQRIWVEKTIIKGRKDRIEGPRALGKVLWSPQKGENGADIYSNMREVVPNDIILHLTDNEGFTGVSLVDKSYIKGKGIKGTSWGGDAYIIELKKFKRINLLSRKDFLNLKYKQLLDKIRNEYKVFYNKELNLNQGAYLTECPIELAEHLYKVYKDTYNESIPYLKLDYHSIPNGNKMKLNYNEFATKLDNINLKFSHSFIVRFIASLLTKPFVILTGLSGSGKTKLAQAFAMWICENENQYCIVPVGADWTNREPLFGFPNALRKRL